jgi:dipeptidyl aminopeptidase/acylaminoacyl peptidase
MQANGQWTPDRDYYIFASWKDLESGNPWPAANLWALREKTSLFHRNSASPTKLTTGPMRFVQYVFTSDGKTMLVLSSLKHGELMRYDRRTKSFSPWASGLSAEGVTFSRDGQWVAYVTYPQGELWRSRIDGSEPLRLSNRPLFASSPAWSPDGSEIAFVGVRAGEPGHAWSVSANGGEPRRISAITEGNDPSWTPDGNSLIYLDKTNGDSNTAINVRNLRTGAVSLIAGSRGFWSPRMSPDGRWIAALSNDLGKLLLFDSRTQAWREVATGGILWPHWSHDSRYLYFARPDANPQIYRVKAGGDGLEPVVIRKDFRITGVIPGWFSLTPQDDVLVLHDTGGGTEIYALSWDAP